MPHATELRCLPLNQTGALIPELTPLGVPDAETRRRHDPTETLVVLNDGGPVACCSIWMRNTPHYNQQPVGVIGHFGAANASAAERVLSEACRLIREAGLGYALGPIDGTTWRRYRLVIEQNPEGDPDDAAPPFFLEPQNPPAYVDYFTAAGFAPVITYHSSLTTDLATPDARAADAEPKLAQSGIRLRPIDPARLDGELRRVYGLSLREFAANPLYTPISEGEFLAMYQGLGPHLVADLVLMAERERELLGYVFALPDLAQVRRGEAVDRIVIKTMAVAGDQRGAGLGGVLLDRVRQAAHAMGFQKAIYALMHDANPSSRLAGRFGTPFRRYAVFGRELRRGRI